MTCWFTSDTHFGHHNIIRYCARPFESTEQMDAEMIRRWNGRVGPTDTCYHLGDVGFWNHTRRNEVVGQLNGTKILMRGNHDRKTSDAAFLKAGFAQVHPFDQVVTVDVQGRQVHMRHTPHFLSPMLPATHVALCGHIHERWKERDGCINVGVDQWAFAPVSLDEMLADAPAVLP